MSAIKLFFDLLHPLGIVKKFTLWGGGGGGGASVTTNNGNYGSNGGMDSYWISNGQGDLIPSGSGAGPGGLPDQLLRA